MFAVDGLKLWDYLERSLVVVIWMIWIAETFTGMGSLPFYASASLMFTCALGTQEQSGDVIKLAGFDGHLKPVPWPLSIWSTL
jgi:hypothetical protein